MAESIPQSHIWLLEKPLIALLGTVMPDGRPQVHPVWADWDGTYIRVNTAVGRQKDENLKLRNYATVLVLHPENNFYWVEVRGTVAERIVGQEAEDHIDKLAKDYMGQDTYPSRTETEKRVLYKIRPEDVVSNGEND